jgi:hypothetical protein
MNMWLNNGVEVSQDPVGVNHDVQVKYAGLLKNDGADYILLHCGVDGWKNTKDVWMNRDQDGNFAASIKAAAAHEVNICFKDTANNWDNNNGWNWRVRVI